MSTRVLSSLVLLACALVLSSCSLVPQGVLDTSDQRADARMELIAEALNNQDAAALKDMFSPYALEQATDVDEGLEYLLSFFPDGGVTWERHTVAMEGHRKDGKESELLPAYYIVTADGHDYWFFFADFTVNDVENPENVGIYALGTTPWAEDLYAGPTGAFFDWSGAIHLDKDGEDGYPGVYVPAVG